MQAIGADVPLGAGEHVRIDVGEDECVGGCGPGAPAECGVHGFLGEVVGDALPHEDGRQRGVVARRGHGRTELAQVEVTRNEGDIRWERAEGAGQGALLRLLRGRVVDLEDGDGPERLEPVRAGVESGTEDHQLTELLGRHGAQGVVDLTRAGHDGSAHARPPAVDGVAQGTFTAGNGGHPVHGGEGPRQEAACECVVEERRRFGCPSLQGTEQRVVLRRSACSVRLHRLALFTPFRPVWSMSACTPSRIRSRPKR
jgi:hypothetical protein